MNLKSPLEKKLVWALVIAAGLVLVSSLLTLATWPPVFIDEPWYSDVAWNLVVNGVPFDTMHTGVLDQWDSAWVRWPVLSILPLAAVFAVGGPGLLAARLVHFLFGVALLVAMFALGRKLYSTLTGALAVFLMSFAFIFLRASHTVRPDILLAVLVVLAFYFYIVGLQDSKQWAFFIAGLLVSLSADVHMNGLMFAAALGLLHVAVYRTRVLRSGATWLFAGGVALGFAYYLAIHIVPNYETYFILSRGWQGSMFLSPILTFSPVALLRSLKDEIGRYDFFQNGLEFAIIGASLIYLAVRRSKPERLLLVFLALTFVLFVLFVQNKTGFYAILFYPFLMIMIAETLVSLMRESQKFGKQWVFVAALLGMFVLNSAWHYAAPIAASRNYDYYAVTDRIASVVSPGSRVMGFPTWWLGLREYDYRSSLSLTYYHLYNGYSLTQGLEAVHPDFVIMDEWQWRLLVDTGYFPPGPGFEMYNLPRQEFESFLAQRGEKVLEFTDPWHGTIEVYAIHWD